MFYSYSILCSHGYARAVRGLSSTLIQGLAALVKNVRTMSTKMCYVKFHEYRVDKMFRNYRHHHLGVLNNNIIRIDTSISIFLETITMIHENTWIKSVKIFRNDHDHHTVRHFINKDTDGTIPLTGT